MDFDLTEEQKDFHRAIRNVCETALRPLASEVDRQGAVPDGNLEALTRVGYMGLLLPESLGGAGGDMVRFLVGTEEVARCCASTALVAGTSLMRFGLPTMLYGSDGLKRRLLPLLAQGLLRGAWAHTEPQGGCDTSHLLTRALQEGPGYLLRGRKTYVLNGPEASALLVVALLEENGQGKRTGVFLLEPPCPGLKMEAPLPMIGARGAKVCGLELQDCRVPAEALLGGTGGPGGEELERLPPMPLLVAGYSLGLAQAALELAIQHARKRVTFGRPIVSYQEVHFKIADMYMNVDVARQLALRAAWLIDARKGSFAESSVAKLFASETAQMCAQSCAHILGGSGLVEGATADRILRDSRVGGILGGTTEMHRLGIAREVLSGRA